MSVNILDEKMKVAVLIATYNSEKYLCDLLNSLRAQTFKEFVCYIHDDGSTDRTREILDCYKEKTSLNIRILDYPPTGSAKANFLSLLSYTDEPYIMFCDHDDVWKETKIEDSLAAIRKIEEEGKPALVFSDLCVVDNNLSELSPSFMKYTGLNPSRINVRQLLLDNVAAGCTMLFNKEVRDVAVQYSDIDNIKIHDHWIMLVAACTGSISYIERPLIYYRQHGDNQIGAIRKMSFPEKFIMIMKKTFSGEYKERFAQWIEKLQRQSEELSNIESIDTETRKLCAGFAGLQDKNKLYRVYFYIHNHMLRENNKIWFLIWC